MLSHRLALPNTLNLNGIFAHLPNLAWTSAGPIEVGELPQALLNARAQGLNLEVFSVDKFPKMVNYVGFQRGSYRGCQPNPTGRLSGRRHYGYARGFCELQCCSAGTQHGRRPDLARGDHWSRVGLGGGSSTQGTLSGGGEIVISIGEQCLVGANAGTGIPLGDRCTIEAGLYITAGTPVTVKDEHGDVVRQAKARELAGHSDLLCHP